MPSLRNLNEGPLSMPQSSGFLQRPIFDHSIQTSSCATSVGLPLTSQGSLFQERAMLLEDPQPVGNGHYSFGTRMSLDSVEKPQVIAPSLLSVNSGEINTAGEVIHGLSNWALPYTNANSGIRGKRQVNIKKQNLRLSPLLQERPYAAVQLEFYGKLHLNLHRSKPKQFSFQIIDLERTTERASHVIFEIQGSCKKQIFN